MKSKAFVIEHTPLDVSKARQYGEIVYLFEQEDERASIFAPEFADDVIDAAEDLGFDPERDFVVAAGSVVTLVRAISALQARYGRINVLFYSALETRYAPVEVGAISHTT